MLTCNFCEFNLRKSGCYKRATKLSPETFVSKSEFCVGLLAFKIFTISPKVTLVKLNVSLSLTLMAYRQKVSYI